MKSADRVRAAIDRTPADRIPIFMWFQPESANKLASYLDVPVEYLEEALGDDIRQTWVNNNQAMEGVVHEHDGQRHDDQWGIRWVRSYGFNQIERFPLKGAAEENVLSYRFPEEHVEELMVPMAETAGLSGEYFLGCDVSPCAFEMYWRLRGLDDALADIAMNERLAERMLGKCVDFSIKLSQIAIERFDLDWLWTGDDVAYQQGMMISPDHWRRLIKPHLARVFGVGIDAGLPVAYHCCGGLRPIIPDLVEIGLDVLNPVQTGCPGMELSELKREFGKDITFMGGVDTQELVPYAGADEVRRETGRIIELMSGDGGGYILAASHTVPPETPIENIFALYDAAGVTREEITDRASDIRVRLERERRG